MERETIRRSLRQSDRLNTHKQRSGVRRTTCTQGRKQTEIPPVISRLRQTKTRLDLASPELKWIVMLVLRKTIHKNEQRARVWHKEKGIGYRDRERLGGLGLTLETKNILFDKRKRKAEKANHGTSILHVLY